MASKRIGRGTDPESGAEWEITAWRATTHGDWKYAKGHEPENQKGSRLTRNAIIRSESLKIAYTYPNGRTVYRTFRGAPPDDLKRIIDYWKNIRSI